MSTLAEQAESLHRRELAASLDLAATTGDVKYLEGHRDGYAQGVADATRACTQKMEAEFDRLRRAIAR